MTYMVPQSIKSKTKIFKWLYKDDLLLCGIYIAIIFLLDSFVAEYLKLYYYVFYGIILLFLIMPSQDNIYPEFPKNFNLGKEEVTLKV